MSKQIYIDSNGNEIQVSGTVNTADMMPMSGNDSTKVSEAIGDLSQLTTTVTSSLVGAVNAVNGKASTTDFTFTPDSSVNTTSVIASQNDKMCVLTMEVNFTGNANAWKEIGVVNKVPKVAHCTAACVNSSNGTYLGMVEVRQSDGKVRIYPTSNVSNGYGIFTLAYAIA